MVFFVYPFVHCDYVEGEAKLREEFDGLLELLRADKVFSKDDIKLAKEKVFGPTTFWVTGVQVAVGKQTDELLPERYDINFWKRIKTVCMYQ